MTLTFRWREQKFVLSSHANEALFVLIRLQNLFISQAKPDVSEKILKEEVEPLTIHNFEDVDFFSYLSALALCLHLSRLPPVPRSPMSKFGAQFILSSAIF